MAGSTHDPGLGETIGGPFGPEPTQQTWIFDASCEDPNQGTYLCLTVTELLQSRLRADLKLFLLKPEYEKWPYPQQQRKKDSACLAVARAGFGFGLLWVAFGRYLGGHVCALMREELADATP